MLLQRKQLQQRKKKQKKAEKKKQNDDAVVNEQNQTDIPLVAPATLLTFKRNTITKDNLLDWLRCNKDDVEALSKLEAQLEAL
jgi:hypothetical protein